MIGKECVKKKSLGSESRILVQYDKKHVEVRTDTNKSCAVMFVFVRIGKNDTTSLERHHQLTCRISTSYLTGIIDRRLFAQSLSSFNIFSNPFTAFFRLTLVTKVTVSFTMFDFVNGSRS